MLDGVCVLDIVCVVVGEKDVLSVADAVWLAVCVAVCVDVADAVAVYVGDFDGVVAADRVLVSDARAVVDGSGDQEADAHGARVAVNVMGHAPEQPEQSFTPAPPHLAAALPACFSQLPPPLRQQ